MKQEKRMPAKWIFPASMILIVFVVLLAVFALVTAGIFLMVRIGVIVPDDAHFPIIQIMLAVFSLASLLIGAGITVTLGSVPVKVFLGLQQGMRELEHGNYATRIHLGGGKLGEDVSRSFNTLAEELEHTEMLRSDFINSFSHEFKTPIVSIYGFAGLLNHGNLSEAETKEYTRIIEEESGRLSRLATNVLELTRVENQEILSGVTEYNVSEQIRTCLLLLEKKWTKKELELDLNLPEQTISGNEELLAQVWINLLDNAIKFAPRCGEVSVGLRTTEDQIEVRVENSGSTISPEDQDRIFQKFYQADASHAQEGFGIGLAIVSRIVTLHHGTVSVDSGTQRTTFTVRLPIVQPN